MPAAAWRGDVEALGVKVVSFFPGNAETGKAAIQGAVLALDPISGEIVALMEGGALTAIRTGAGAGAATDLLARPELRQLRQDFVEARAEVLEHVVTVEALPMTSVQRGGGAPDQHGPRHEGLEMSLRSQEALPVRQILSGHTEIVALGRVDALRITPGPGP